MRETKATKTARFFRSLEKIGVSYEDADKLRLIERTLHRWAELECGDGNEYGSWMIERDEETDKPYFIHHAHVSGSDRVITTRITRTPTARPRKGRVKASGKDSSKLPRANLLPSDRPARLLPVSNSKRQVERWGNTGFSLYTRCSLLHLKEIKQ